MSENKTRFEIVPSVEVEGIGIVSGALVRKYSHLTGGRVDNWDIYDDDAAEEIMSIPANDPRFPLQEGELELIEAMVYGFNHPRIHDSWGKLNEDGMFWAAKVMEALSNYQQMIRISAVLTPQFFQQLKDGDASFNEVEWEQHMIPIDSVYCSSPSVLTTVFQDLMLSQTDFTKAVLGVLKRGEQ